MNDEKPTEENSGESHSHKKEEKLHRDYHVNPSLKKKLEEKKLSSSKKGYKNIAMLSSMGVGLVLNVLLGFFVGSFLDKRFDTFPSWTAVFVILGIIIGFYNIFYILKKYGDFKF